MPRSKNVIPTIIDQQPKILLQLFTDLFTSSHFNINIHCATGIKFQARDGWHYDGEKHW